MTKPESLLELVARLDKYHNIGGADEMRDLRWHLQREWPRLRDAMNEMRAELERVKMVVGEVDYDIIEALLARLDNPEKQ